jgi:hypothetical protein
MCPRATPTRSATAVCILLVVSLAVHVQNAATAQNERADGKESGRILSLENAWNQAETGHNAIAMSMLIADPFAYTDDDGAFMGRARWLSPIKNDVHQYEQLGNTGMKVQLYGNAAIVNGFHHERLRIKRKPVSQSGRFTDTWIRQNGEWKCVASQATLMVH